MMDELAGTENRLSVERMRYNEKVQAYDTRPRKVAEDCLARLYRADRATR